jgi:hypothetical protein
MMTLLATRLLLTDVSEQEALDEALEGLALIPADDVALLVLTEDAGSATALRFYAEALAIGPALASPAAFPWCLANAPCGMLARRFGFRGPNVTWMVQDLDNPASYTPAVTWIEDSSEPAVIAAIRFGDPGARIVIWWWEPNGALPSRSALRREWCEAASETIGPI